ncbi:unnamed protein product, partial [Didymodactylos carnosus]
LLKRHPSDFIALHCQEVGGKNYEQFMYILDRFIKEMLLIPEISQEYTHYRLYFDSDYTSQDTFTALGSAYFIRQNIPVQQWNFQTSSFEAVVDRQIFTGNLIETQSLRKEKFPREFFPEAKWSRKGFTQTRWAINGRLPFNKTNSQVPFAIFGDFNFRIDSHRFLEYKMLDLESQSFQDQLFEFEKTFPPSYPFSEENNEARSYLKARCPSWCDRILLSHSLKSYVNLEENRSVYGIIGQDVCMGDHKPVYLALTIRLAQGSCSSNTSSSLSSPLLLPSHCSTDLMFDKKLNNQHHHSNAPSFPDTLVDTSTITENSSTSIDTNNYKNNNDDNNKVYLNNVEICSLFPNDEKTKTLDEQKNDIHINVNNTYNVHDFAYFVQPYILPSWSLTLKTKPSQKQHLSNSNVLWAKVRAITYLTGRKHRHGSWYSEDPTEITEMDVDDKMEEDEMVFPHSRTSTITVTQFDSTNYKTDIPVPFRRSYSSNVFVKGHDNISEQTLLRRYSMDSGLIDQLVGDHDADNIDVVPSSTMTTHLSTTLSKAELNDNSVKHENDISTAQETLVVQNIQSKTTKKQQQQRTHRFRCIIL